MMKTRANREMQTCRQRLSALPGSNIRQVRLPVLFHSSDNQVVQEGNLRGAGYRRALLLDGHQEGRAIVQVRGAFEQVKQIASSLQAQSVAVLNWEASVL